MIELTDEQAQAVSDATPVRLVNPKTKEFFVLLRADEYRRLADEPYDDSPWTREEIEAVAAQTAERAGWEEYGDDENSAERK